MSNGFPPLPVYPYGIDDDSTLFLVHNTSESPLTVNNEAWAEEVPVQPQKLGSLEIWADNGFATINGEMFYYDAVDKDINGYVNNLKNCIRNLGGVKTKPNLAGTMVRGFVMAEHHNQLVDAVARIEGFVGENFSSNEETLDWRIRNLNDTPTIFDDFDCPDVNFTFNITNNNPAAGITASYVIEINGNYTDFTLNFGDGTFTKSAFSGEHVYAPNAIIDPVITISSDKCKIVQSPIARTSSTTPDQTFENNTIDLPIPVCPDIGDIFIPTFSIPPSDIILPPFVFPNLGVSPISGGIGPISISVDFSPVGIPSIISFTPLLNIPSIISFTPLSIPTLISIQSPSLVVPNIPNISLLVPSIPNISLLVPSIPNISLTVPSFAQLSVNWGIIPTIPVNITVACDCVSCPSAMSMALTDSGPALKLNALSSKQNITSPEEPVINYDFSNFPSTITIEPPVFPELKMTHDLPNSISLTVPEEMLNYIRTPLPKEINLISPIEPINLSYIGPSVINLDSTSINEGIRLLAPDYLPKLIIDASMIPSTIQVVGIPSIIEITHTIPSIISVAMPENMSVQMMPPKEPIPISVTINLAVESLPKNGK